MKYRSSVEHENQNMIEHKKSDLDYIEFTRQNI